MTASDPFEGLIDPLVALNPLADLRKIDKLASACAYQARRYGYPFSLTEAVEEGWSAMVERLALSYASGVTVSREDLLAAGMKELMAQRREYNGARGDRAVMYWKDAGAGQENVTAGRVRHSVEREAVFAKNIVDRMALREVLKQMPTDEQEVLLVFAANDCQAARAAQHLLISRQTFQRRLASARRLFYAIWFDWEPAPKIPAARKRNYNTELKTYCTKGHEFTAENTSEYFEKARGKRYRYCLTCNRENSARQKAKRKVAT